MLSDQYQGVWKCIVVSIRLHGIAQFQGIWGCSVVSIELHGVDAVGVGVSRKSFTCVEGAWLGCYDDKALHYNFVPQCVK